MFCIGIIIYASHLKAEPQSMSLVSVNYDSLVKISEGDLPDSIRINSLLQLASLDYSHNAFETSINRRAFLDKAYNIAKQNNSFADLAVLIDRIGVSKRNRGKYEIALLLHEYALGITVETGGKLQSSICYNNLGVVYRRIDEYYKALECHISALKLSEEIENKKSQAVAINSIGNIQMALGNPDDALEYFEQSLVLEKELDNKLGTAINLNNIGNIYFAKDELMKALEYYRLSLDINKQINSNRGMAICYSDIGRVNQKLNNIDKALQYYLMGLSINLKHRDKIFLSESYINVASIYIQKNDFESAHKNIMLGLEIAKEIGAKDNIMNANYSLYEISMKKNQYEKALQYSDTFHVYKDSIMGVSLQKDIAKLKISFESERNENMISRLEQNSKIDQLELKRQKVILWLILSAFVIALGVVAFLAYYLYNKNHSNRLLTQKNEEIDKARQRLEKLASDLLKAKQEADQSNKIKTEFLTNISHEIRTPLNSVIGYSELLSTHITDDTLVDYLDSINISANSLLVLINDVLDLSKIEAGKITVEYKPLFIRTLFGDIESIFTNRAKEKNIYFNIHIDEDVPATINFSDLRLRQIMINLVGNALKFTDKGGVDIFVKLKENKTDEFVNLVIVVKDTGKGIPVEEQENIYEPFYQLNNESSEGGTGLGLSITKRLVEALNGKISLKSIENKESIFTIEFEDTEVLEADELLNNNMVKEELIFNIPATEKQKESIFEDYDEFSKCILIINREEKDLMRKLKMLYTYEFERAKETKLFDEILKFNDKFKTIIVNSGHKSLVAYSHNLSLLIEQFNIEGIEIYFNHFESAIKHLPNNKE